MSSAVARASSRSDVLSLYRRFLRLAEPYVESPGVKRFLQDQLMAEARGQSLSAADLAEYKMQLTDNHALAAYVRDFVGEHFRRNKVVNNRSEGRRLLKEAKAELKSVEEQIVKAKKSISD